MRTTDKSLIRGIWRVLVLALSPALFALAGPDSEKPTAPKTIGPGVVTVEEIVSAHHVHEFIAAEPMLLTKKVWLFAPVQLDSVDLTWLRVVLWRAGIDLRKGPSQREYAPPQAIAYYLTGVDLNRNQPPRPRASAESRPLDYIVATYDVLNVDPHELAATLKREVDRREADIPEEKRTRFIPDPHSRKLLIRIADRAQLEEYRPIIYGLDRPKEVERPIKLETYAGQYVAAATLAEEFKAAWKETGRPPLHLVVHDPSNTVLLKGPAQLLPEALKILKSLDQVRVTPRPR